MEQKNKLTFAKLAERFSYGCGDFGCNIIYTAMSAFLMFYYSDYAGVNTLAVGTIMLVSRVFDGVSDIIMGIIVDRTKSRFGKARPWLLRMCIPFAISGILLFSVPAGMSETAKLVYVFVTYNLTSTVIYTAINVPYSSLNALMTQDPYERSVLSIFRNVLATCGTLLINLVTLPLVRAFGDNASAWTKAFVVLGFLAVAAFLINFAGTKERVKPASAGEGEAQNVPVKEGILALFQNKYWIMMTGVLALFFLYYAIRWGFSPRKVFRLALAALEEDYGRETILKWLKNFYRRFFAQQFKRSCLPDGPKVGTLALSPRGDWRMPSDAVNALWMKELETL